MTDIYALLVIKKQSRKMIDTQERMGNSRECVWIFQIILTLTEIDHLRVTLK